MTITISNSGHLIGIGWSVRLQGFRRRLTAPRLRERAASAGVARTRLLVVCMTEDEATRTGATEGVKP